VAQHLTFLFIVFCCVISKYKFKNDVVYKGKILTRQETLNYGQAVMDVVRSILKQVEEKYPEGVQKTIFRHLKECRTSEDNKQP